MGPALPREGAERRRPLAVSGCGRRAPRHAPGRRRRVVPARSRAPRPGLAGLDPGRARSRIARAETPSHAAARARRIEDPGRMNLALFDLDNTLLAGDSDYEWGQFLVDRGVLDGAEYEAQKREY